MLSVAPVDAGAHGAPAFERWERVEADALARLDAARASLSDGGLEAAVEAAIGLAGRALPRVPSTRRLPLPGLSPALSGPLGELLGALDTAERLEDRGRLHAAARLLARSLDRALPALAAAAAATPPGPAGAGCDVVDQPPALCIGGVGPNVHDRDYALLIDLGGDDLHAHTAGGARPDEHGNGLPVSVTVDVAGRDRYRHHYQHGQAVEGPGIPAQGSGWLGGIGILVDRDGDDDYEATAGDDALTLAQGVGWAGGVGIRADLAGDDVYRVAHVGLPPRASVLATYGGVAAALGFGVASLGGLGIALDDHGDDRYVLEVLRPEPRTADGTVRLGSPAAVGFGWGATGGATILSDGAGNDEMLLRAETPPVAAEEPRPVDGAHAVAAGFGIGTLGGAGAVFTGDGRTTASITASVPETPTQGLAGGAGFGVGVAGGLGAVDDAGGDDAYLIEAVSRTARSVTVGDGCGCEGAVAAVKSRGARVVGMGHTLSGILSAVPAFTGGILRDRGGDDRYTLRAEKRVEARARDDRETVDPPSDPDDAAARATVETEGATAVGQASGTDGEGGWLVDEAGDDAYEARASLEIVVGASSRRPDAPVATKVSCCIGQASFYGSYGLGAFAQAVGSNAGHGELKDLGGRDVYDAFGSISVTGDPAPEYGTPESFRTPRMWIQASAVSGTARLIDIDGGQADVFRAQPDNPACMGTTRGDPHWFDCTGIPYGWPVSSGFGINN